MQVLVSRSRRGFTLIELLMVITIIGLLALLGTCAAFTTMQRAKEATILMEISSLDQSFSEYKTAANGFPPCMGDATPTSRASRFYTHVTRAFPRYIARDANQNPTPSYAGMRQQIINNFSPGNASGWYDLDTMDQAEALVFWLSGFPTPRAGNTSTGYPLQSSKILGFCSSPTAPFFGLPGSALGAFSDTNATILSGIEKRPPIFNFDESRLVDQDGDGWLEYVPTRPDSATMYPPYVYFDGDLITAQTTASATVPFLSYPAATTGFGPTPGLVQSWGLATPYAKTMPVSGAAQLEWINPRKFQIICSGLDYSYGNYGTQIPSGFGNALPKIWPAGIRFDNKGADNDNLTNFADGRKLGDGLQ